MILKNIFLYIILHLVFTAAHAIPIKNKTDYLISLNDNCEQAQTLTVSENHECLTSFTLNFQGATASGLSNSCGGNPNDDIWFEFTAISSVHVISISKIVGTAPIISGTIYANDCGNLEQIQCLSSGNNRIHQLTTGETYKIRLYSMVTQLNTISSFDICITTLSPPISISINHTNEEMLNEISSEMGCIDISNIVTKSGLDHPHMSQYPANSVEGIGFFRKNNSLFPLEKGIVLSTGNVLSAPGPKSTQDQSSGSTFWPGDEDLNNLLTDLEINGETLHASSLEFDFTSETDYFAMEYIFASDEYGNRCNNHDLVAFFLTDTETGDRTNIATVPETNDIVSVVTIRNGQYQQSPINCNSNNIEYFSNYYDGISPESQNAPINFRGNSSLMKTEVNIIPNRNYHLKIVIAEQKTGFIAGPGGVIYYDPYDTAVFISNITSIPDQIDLGKDYLISDESALCLGDSVNISSNLDSENYSFEWYRDQSIINGENQSSINIEIPGTYNVRAYYKNSSCYIEDDIVVEFYPEMLKNLVLSSIEVCTFNNTIDGTIDISIHENQIKDSITPHSTAISYHESEDEAVQGNNSIENINNYTPSRLPQTIYIRITNESTFCTEIITFDVVEKNFIRLSNPDDLEVCSYNDRIQTINLKDAEESIISQTTSNLAFQYFRNISNAENQTNEIEDPENYIISNNSEIIYIVVNDSATGCDQILLLNIKETAYLAPVKLEKVTSCKRYTLPSLPDFNFYSTEPYGQGQILSSGDILERGSHVLYINTMNELNCVYSTIFEIEVTVDCIIPKGISPNGDGINDYWDLSIFYPYNVIIFNRHGKEVYQQKNGYTNQWYGQDNNGNLLPEGTYFYKFTSSHENHVYSGYVYISRELK